MQNMYNLIEILFFCEKKNAKLSNYFSYADEQEKENTYFVYNYI